MVFHVCVSPGCGEHLIRTMLARECSAAMQSEDAHQALLEAMQNKFISESASCSLMTAALQTNTHSHTHTHPYACSARQECIFEPNIKGIKPADVPPHRE